MKALKDCVIGFAVTGSFCTFRQILKDLKILADSTKEVIPILSYQASGTNNRFMSAKDFVSSVTEITGREPVTTIPDAEPFGPRIHLDALVIAPCTGNTMAKLCNGITDTPVLMAAKAHLRNLKPLILSISTNDALSMNFKNIGELMNMKQIYFVPFGQDNYEKKPNSMVADTKLIPQTIQAALEGIQIQPVLYNTNHG